MVWALKGLDFMPYQPFSVPPAPPMSLRQAPMSAVPLSRWPWHLKPAVSGLGFIFIWGYIGFRASANLEPEATQNFRDNLFLPGGRGGGPTVRSPTLESPTRTCILWERPAASSVWTQVVRGLVRVGVLGLLWFI